MKNAEPLSDIGDRASALDSYLAEVLEEYMAARSAGRAPPRDELLARHPALAEQLVACLGSLEFIHKASPQASSGKAQEVNPRGAAASPCITPQPGSTLPLATRDEWVNLEDFRIVRELGRGGMGIVYEAEQLSLGRRVALKVLPFAAALDRLQLQRFRNEAQAAAQLQHPHIVPVFGVGSEHDVNYYVMKYIQGRTLANLIHERRAVRAGSAAPNKNTESNGEKQTQESQCGEVARLGIQAASALEHAHQAGIIHRDIKPANLLVDEADHLWITDFGLAHFQHDARNLTLSGDLIGTLRYMSPEQAVAKRGIVDQRSDIYSLGATLYELSTLEPAFRGQDRRELLRQIAEEEPRPPRRLNKAIPVSLETILLKAMSKEPAGRYATARELADDLERFLADQPITAKRPTLLTRARRWARRHKPLVVSAAAVAILAFFGSAVSSVFILRERNEAEHRAQQALQAVDDMYTQVAQRWWYQQPYMEQVQREFLLKALRFYEEFTTERDDAPRWRLETTKAARRVGDIQHRLGEHAKATRAYESAIGRLTALALESPEDRVRREELAHAHNNYANLLHDKGSLADAEPAYRQAHALFTALATDEANTPADRDGLAGTLANLGMVLHAQGRPADAEKAYRRALEVFVVLTKDCPDVPSYRHGLAGCRNNLASLMRDMGRPRAALAAYEQALADWSKLTAELPGLPTFRQAQAASYAGVGIVQAALGRSAAAEAAHRRALALRQGLVQSYPSVPAYRQALAASHHSLGRLLTTSGRVQDARAAYTQALALRQHLAKEFPAVPAYRRELADSFDGQAALLAAAGQPGQAAQALCEAQALRQQLAKESSGTPDAQWDLARGNRALGNNLSRLGRLEEAANLLRQAVTQSETLTTSFQAAPAFQMELASARGDLALLCVRTGNVGEAEQLHRAALVLREKLAADLADAPYHRLDVAAAHSELAGLLVHTGRPAEAETAWRHALAIGEKLAADFPSVPDYRRLLARAYCELGELQMLTGRCQEAERALQKARPLLDKLAAEFGELPGPRVQLARYYHAVGGVELSTSRPVAAEVAFQKELSLREKLAADFPEETGYALDLAYLLADCPDATLREPQRAVAVANKAVAACPKDAWAWYVLGIAHYRAGAFEEAARTLEQAEKLPGKHAGEPFVLALAHWYLGNKSSAEERYHAASARMGQDQPLDEGLRRIYAEAKAAFGSE
jgi:serine/threonine protein kinase